MKKVQMFQYEAGDHVMVTTGFNRGKVGVVIRHPAPNARVIYALTGSTYDIDEDDEDNYDEYDDDYYGEYEDSPTSALKFITKKEHDDLVKKLKIITVPGLPVGVRFQGSNLVIGDNVITSVNAKKLATFITEHTSKKKGKKK